MISTRDFRNLIDECATYSELIPFLQIIVEQPINKEFGNSCLHALSFLTDEHLNYDEWIYLLQKLLTSFTTDKFDKSSYPSLIRVYSTEFGFKFLESQQGYLPTIEHILEMMEMKNIILRRRTLAPILEVSYREESMKTLAMSVFGIAKVHQIQFDSRDLSYLLCTVSTLDQKTIVREILQSQTLFTEEAIKLISINFPTSSFMVNEAHKCGDYTIPGFQFSKDEQKQMLLSLQNQVEEKTTQRKSIRKAFHKFCHGYKKNITAVVDGANVGRFQQGTNSQGALNYHQIKNVIVKLNHDGHRVLLCINENHFKKMDSQSQAVLSQIRSLCQVLPTPSGLDDDLCWLYACLSLPKAFLVTTDELRNHIYSVHSQLEVWKQYRRVTFSISRETGEVDFSYPVPYHVKPHLELRMETKQKTKLWIPTTIEKWTCVEL